VGVRDEGWKAADTASYCRDLPEDLVLAGLPHFRLYDLRHTYASHLIAERADIAYVAKQLGHAKMTTTLLFYGHWFPRGDRKYVEQMEKVRAAAAPLKLPTPHDDAGAFVDADASPNVDSWHQFGPTRESGASDPSEAPDFIGGPSRTRTWDPLIKSETGDLHTDTYDEVRARDSEGW
jgi:hypothetical protein